jgi:hypothetical protein
MRTKIELHAITEQIVNEVAMSISGLGPYELMKGRNIVEAEYEASCKSFSLTDEEQAIVDKQSARLFIKKAVNLEKLKLKGMDKATIRKLLKRTKARFGKGSP